MRYLTLLLAAYICACSLVGLPAPAFAEEGEEEEEKKPEGVQYSATVGVTFTQTSFVDWVAGGEDALTYVLNFKGGLSEDRANDNWKIEGALGFGQSKAGGQETRISGNEIKIEGQYNYKLPKQWSAYAAAGFRSAIVTGYDYTEDPKKPKASFNDPGYYTASLGGKKHFSQEPTLFTSRAGLGLKYTTAKKYFEFGYANDPDTEEPNKTKLETGIDSVTELNAQISENLLCESKLILFSAFKHLDVWDVLWETAFKAKINKYVNAELYLTFLFDKDVSGRVQRYEMLSIGLSYSIF